MMVIAQFATRNSVMSKACNRGRGERASRGPPGECGDSQCQGQDWARSARDLITLLLTGAKSETLTLDNDTNT